MPIDAADSSDPHRGRLRLIVADRRAYREPYVAATVGETADYLDHVADELDRRGVPVGSVEIDARAPVTGRLVLTGPSPAYLLSPRLDMPAAPRVVSLHWHQDRGWTMARGMPDGIRHPIARTDIEPAELASRVLPVLHPGLLRPRPEIAGADSDAIR